MKLSELKIYRLLTSLESLPVSRLSMTAIGVVLFLGGVDYLTGFELSFSFFYLIPVTMTAWALGRETGLAFSVFSASVWLISNLLSGQNFSSIFAGTWNALIRFGFYAVVTILLTELHRVLEEERLLANTDPLTGALNRRSFHEIAEKKMIISEMNKRPYTLVYIDLDYFKSINDSLGHVAGDRVLKTIVDTLQNHIRNSDILARLGGDEFAILLMDIDQKQAQVIVQRLQSSLLEKMQRNGWEVTFSIGVLTVLSMPESVNTLINMTDTLMYEVKDKGRNAIQYSTFE